MLKKVDELTYVFCDGSIVNVYECGRVEFFPASGRGWSMPKKLQLVKSGDRWAIFYLFRFDSQQKALKILELMDGMLINAKV